MKKAISILLLLLLAGALSACAQAENTETSARSSAVSVTEETSQTTTAENTEETNMNKITVIIGNREFKATLYDNDTVKAFANRLPLTLDMKELHGNEKYYYFDSALPSAASVPKRINSGDIKLFGGDCLVLFYDSFTTPYSYTDIGKIDNPEGLKEALGNDNITITFCLD